MLRVCCPPLWVAHQQQMAVSGPIVAVSGLPWSAFEQIQGARPGLAPWVEHGETARRAVEGREGSERSERSDEDAARRAAPQEEPCRVWSSGIVTSSQLHVAPALPLFCELTRVCGKKSPREQPLVATIQKIAAIM